MFSLSTAVSCSSSRWDSSRVFLLHCFSPVTQLNQFIVMLEACWRECQTRSTQERRKKKCCRLHFTPPRLDWTGSSSSVGSLLSLCIYLCVHACPHTAVLCTHVICPLLSDRTKLLSGSWQLTCVMSAKKKKEKKDKKKKRKYLSGVILL